MIEVKKTEYGNNELKVDGLSDNSRLYMFNVLKNKELEYYFNIFRNYTMEDEYKTDKYYDTYIVDNDDWWDNISAHWYDDTELWWIICIMNDIINPFEEIYPGKIIKILKKQYCYDIIEKFKKIANCEKVNSKNKL
jgi:hypothetical protein